MPAPQLTAEQIKKIAEVYKTTGGNKTKTAKLCGLDRNTITKYVKADFVPTDKKARAAVGLPAEELEEATKLSEDSNGNATLVIRTDEIIRTLEDAIRVGKVDQSVWFVDRYEISNWTTPMNVKRGQELVTLKSTDGKGREKSTDSLAWRESSPMQLQQYRVKLFLKRILKRSVSQALDIVFQRFQGRHPAVKLVRQTGKQEPHLAVVGLSDVHFGKLCWAAETGDNYDLKIADRVLKNAVHDLLAKSSHLRIAQFVLPMGNDWLHIDNKDNTTTRGTPQDVDGRFAKVYAAAVEAAVWAVEVLAGLAPVRVEWVPGNHDRTLSLTMCHVVSARFHKSKQVSVNLSPSHRKYFRWGANLLGFTHGDQTEPDKLPNLMATESPDDWAATKSGTREWLIGHMHRSRKWVTKPVDTFEGTTVRTMQSIAGTDAYHHEHGYVSGRHAAEVFWYGERSGYAGHVPTVSRMD